MKKYGKPVSKSQFEEMIREITTAESVTGIVYHYSYESRHHCIVSGRRDSTGNAFKIKFDELLDAYNKLNCDDLKPSALKKYITGRVQSPACALLRELELRNK